mmetsp:Transcript_3599/g.13272  ORF Transcript_3599/g.13272 Transcript_3599/m.13272 type:complete len:285 (+) Transcript_3599:1076-1930(+)
MDFYSSVKRAQPAAAPRVHQVPAPAQRAAVLHGAANQSAPHRGRAHVVGAVDSLTRVNVTGRAVCQWPCAIGMRPVATAVLLLTGPGAILPGAGKTLLRVRRRRFALRARGRDVLARAVLLNLEEVLLRVAPDLNHRLGADVGFDFLPVAVVQVDCFQKHGVFAFRPRFARLGDRVRLARLRRFHHRGGGLHRGEDVCLVPCLRRGVPFPDVFRPQPRSPGRRVRCYRTVNGACSRRNVFPSCSARRARVTNAFPRLAQEHHTRSRHTQPRADVFPGGVFSQAV